ncbi:WD40 repeat-like protein [Eremomyces bilateralis CBS 781.70]|uniref:WD40 repeat-like protein n=1 Tax=Eremomyces bilateralis CBS 781.70 TaxID=1392243 RepID=A0A6G1GHJ8_9PEZI|nr:WD40 repeat-like protein [Eremomyces bilateralis CBS 781.70]KAF1817484.1 WD40 repeat-like protein [Eremomyces bilateralis CBS 781.70]
MKATPLLISWHNDQSPIYSCHFEPHGKGRLATAGGDSNVRLWKVESNGDSRSVSYLSTLVKHTQTVNVVRWCPRGETLGSAGDDGNVLLWVPSEHPERTTFGEDGLDNKETWRVKHMFRSMGSEIYDMAWSPDGTFFITGSMDNIARIYNAHTGQAVRQIAEHNHYVQGVAWDPLNEFVATQSSDRSVHIYTLRTKDGQFSLANHSKVTKMDLPSRRISSNSPAPPDMPHRTSFHTENRIGSPIPSAPGTPNSLALPMNPPLSSRSRRSSFESSPSMRRSASPAPSVPLPAVMPGNSPSIGGIGAPVTKNTNIYANETFISFFRRLTFSSDGALLFTPAGQYKTHVPATSEFGRPSEDTVNTVYIYTRAGLNKPPIAYLPGHKKPSIAVKCSPVYYTLRQSPVPTKNIIVDTSSLEEEIAALPEPALPNKVGTPQSTMDPPPFTSAPSPSPSMLAASPKASEPDTTPTSAPPSAGPTSAFALPYRMVYAVATLDAVHIYDTQQTLPLCIVSNLHYAIFTDLTWSSDGNTLIISSSDGFCSTLAFSQNELGTVYTGPVPTASRPTPTPSHSGIAVNTSTAASSAHSTPTPTPTSSTIPKPSTIASTPATTTASSLPSASTPHPFPAPPSPMSSIHSASNTEYARPRSPARSMSASSIASSLAPHVAAVPPSAPNNSTASATSSTAQPPSSNHPSTPAAIVPGAATPSFSAIPSVAATNSGPVPGMQPLWTPPLTPGASSISNTVPGAMSTHSARSSISGIGSGAGFVGTALSGVTSSETAVESESEREVEGQKDGGERKRGADEGEDGETRQTKKRRIAPTLVEDKGTG